MTNHLHAVLFLVATNWTTIGTFNPVQGQPEEVQKGNLVTNVTAIFDYKGQKKEYVLETLTGPEVGERRVPKAQGYAFSTNWPSYYYWSPGLTITNLVIPNWSNKIEYSFPFYTNASSSLLSTK